MQPLNFIAQPKGQDFFLIKLCLTETNYKVLRYYKKKEGLHIQSLFLFIISNLFIVIKSYDTLLDDQNVFELYNFLLQGLIN